jgi:hypothetical protein
MRPLFFNCRRWRETRELEERIGALALCLAVVARANEIDRPRAVQWRRDGAWADGTI